MNIFSKLFYKNKIKNNNTDNDLDISYSLPNYVRAKSTIYLQDRLNKIIGNSIRLKLVKPNKAKYPNEWILDIPNVIVLNDRKINGDLALVDNSNNLYGVLFQQDIDKCGKKENEYVDCIITKTSQNHIELWIPYSPEKLIEQEEKDKLTFNIIVNENHLRIKITEENTYFENCILIIEENTGTKKPFIILKTIDDIIIFKIDARNKYYKELEPWINKKAKQVNIYKNKSKYNENEYYYIIKFNFYDK